MHGFVVVNELAEGLFWELVDKIEQLFVQMIHSCHQMEDLARGP